MTTLYYIVGYITIGVVFTFLVDIMNLLMKQVKEIDYAGPSEGEWGFGEHIACILFWPYAIWTFIKTFFQKKK